MKKTKMRFVVYRTWLVFDNYERALPRREEKRFKTLKPAMAYYKKHDPGHCYEETILLMDTYLNVALWPGQRRRPLLPPCPVVWDLCPF